MEMLKRHLKRQNENLEDTRENLSEATKEQKKQRFKPVPGQSYGIYLVREHQKVYKRLWMLMQRFQLNQIKQQKV